ncbi:MAG TPA: C39 family peptidase [Kofleriaceae bacterium]|nr:C39 family peptidase [Kofleriaceae bacterium]
MHHFKQFAFVLVVAAGSFAGCVASAPGSSGEDDGSGSGEGGTAGSGSEDSSAGAGEGSGSGAGDIVIAAQTTKVLEHQYLAQQTGYWCGPASTRMVLSTVTNNLPTQQTLANELPTSTNGTDHIGLVVNALNKHLGARYAAVLMPNDPPTQAQRDQLWRDIVLSVDAGHGIVANIVAPPSNHPPGYPNSTIYHYISLIGYNADTKQVYVADPARFSGIEHYWLSFDQTATLIPPKGYATYRCGVGRTLGEIDKRYQAFGGCSGFLGTALTDEMTTPDGVGKYNVFVGGSIYWSPSTGAFEVHGAIRDKWRDLGWEAGALGYPTSNETKTPDNVGRFSVFQRGSIYWTPVTGAHEVRGAIRDKYMQTGWESGPLGYPVSDEYAVAGGRKSDFEHGSITWDAAANSSTVTMK